jgi:hypothetical protein
MTAPSSKLALTDYRKVCKFGRYIQPAFSYAAWTAVLHIRPTPTLETH